MLSKLSIIVFFILCFSCVRVGDNESGGLLISDGQKYAFFFDPRAIKYQEDIEKAENRNKKFNEDIKKCNDYCFKYNIIRKFVYLVRDRGPHSAEVNQIINQSKFRCIKDNLIYIVNYYDAEIAAKNKETLLKLQEIENEEKRQEELKRQQKIAEEQESQKLIEYKKQQEQNVICQNYINKCRLVEIQTCSPITKCDSVNGKKVCWQERSCEIKSKYYCKGIKPDYCKIHSDHEIVYVPNTDNH